MWRCFGLFHNVANDNTTQSAVRQDVAVLIPVTVLATASSGGELQTEAEHHGLHSVAACACGWDWNMMRPECENGENHFNLQSSLKILNELWPRDTQQLYNKDHEKHP